MSVAEVFAKIVFFFEQDIEQIANQVSKIVAVIRTNPFSDCILPKESPDPFDAYEGSARLGQLLGGCTQQQGVLCICGHRHKALDITVSGVRVVRSPVGYLNYFKGDYTLKAAEVVQQYVI